MSSGLQRIMTPVLYAILILPSYICLCMSACSCCKGTGGAMYKYMFSFGAAICALMILFATIPTIQGSRVEEGIHVSLSQVGLPVLDNIQPFQTTEHADPVARSNGATRRLLIGSTAPICTYNECRGCKATCRAEQVPVDANDPLNSAYHYRCVCHK